MSQYMEKKIAECCIAELLGHGFCISVNDGEETTLTRSTDPAAIVGAMFTTDEDWLLVERGEVKEGFVRFIYGNDGWDVINNYTTNLEPYLTKTNALAEEMSK